MAPKLTIFFSVCILASFGCAESEEENNEHKLIFLQILSNHGERTPLYTYPTDTNPPLPEVIPQLTKRGKRQQYAVGEVLRFMYSDFITSNPNEVFVNSSSLDYALQSAETLLSSLYAPTSEWAFLEDLDWQPIPVYYATAPDDDVNSLKSCNNLTKVVDSVLQSPTYQKEFEKFKPMLKDVMFFSGIKNDSPYWIQFMLMFDSMQIEKVNGLNIPIWAEYYWNEMNEFFEFIFKTWFSDDETRKICSEFLVQSVVESMEKKIAGELADRKVQVYSAHDPNVVLMLMAIQAYNNKHPPLSATIALELYESPNNQTSVRVLYLNSTEPENGFQEPHVLTIKGCTEYCPYEYFLNITKELVVV